MYLLYEFIASVYQLTFIDEPPDPNISTFRPLDQRVKTNIRYNGDGYLPCKGNLPCQVLSRFIVLMQGCFYCFYSSFYPRHIVYTPPSSSLNVSLQPWHLPPEVNEERIDGAMPCHNYQGGGDGPEGCWWYFQQKYFSLFCGKNSRSRHHICESYPFNPYKPSKSTFWLTCNDLQTKYQ